jgi:hypothetical protein
MAMERSAPAAGGEALQRKFSFALEILERLLLNTPHRPLTGVPFLIGGADDWSDNFSSSMSRSIDIECVNATPIVLPPEARSCGPRGRA